MLYEYFDQDCVAYLRGMHANIVVLLDVDLFRFLVYILVFYILYLISPHP